MKTIPELFETILSADREQAKKAAGDVRKVLYASGGEEKYKEIAAIVDEAPAAFYQIREEFRQQLFVTAISVIHFLHKPRQVADFHFTWLFDLLLHKNGYIRYAAVRMFENDLGPLTVHLRHPGSHSEISPEQADSILYQIFEILSHNAFKTYDPSYRKSKYVQDLPSSPYKSLQQALGLMREYCG